MEEPRGCEYDGDKACLQKTTINFRKGPAVYRYDVGADK